MGGFLWRNLTSTELHAVCLLLHVDPEVWPEVLANVMYMGGEVAEYLNSKGSR